MKTSKLPHSKTKARVMPQSFLSQVPSKSELTRQKILEATLESLSIKGIEGTTYQEIARHAGVGVSHVAYHFPNKQELIQEAIRTDTLQYRAVLDQYLSRAASGEERLRAFLEANFHWHRLSRHRLTWLLEFYLSAQEKRVAQYYVDARAEGRKIIKDIIGPELVRRGFSYESLENEAMAVQMMATGFLIEFIARYPLGAASELVTPAIDRIVSLVFSGGRADAHVSPEKD